MKFIISNLLAFSLLLNSTAFAQQAQKIDLPSSETPEGEVDPGLAISPMKIMQKAPFTGVLLAPKSIAQLIARLNSFDKEKNLAVKEATELQKEVCLNEKNNQTIMFDATKSILEARVKDQNEVIKAYTAQIEKQKSEESNPAAWALIGGAAGVALTVLTTFAVAQAIK